jgi:hypothetical protein
MTTLFYILFLFAQANDDDDCAFDLTRREPTGLTNRLEGLFETSKPKEKIEPPAPQKKRATVREPQKLNPPPKFSENKTIPRPPKKTSDAFEKFSVPCETRREFYRVGENSPFRTIILAPNKRDFQIAVFWNDQQSIFYFGMQERDSKGSAVINSDGTFQIKGLPLFTCEGKISENDFEATLTQTEFEPPINGVVSKDTITCSAKMTPPSAK